MPTSDRTFVGQAKTVSRHLVFCRQSTKSQNPGLAEFVIPLYQPWLISIFRISFTKAVFPEDN
jgi:hypothetical protein